MNECVSTALSAWQSFYVIVGSAAAALIGIQFVVITLVVNMRRPASPESISAFATPTVVQLASVLLVSAILSAPWPSFCFASIMLAICGLGGLAYSVIIIRRARRQTYYQPVRADWLWYALLPCSMYAALTIAAVLLRTAMQSVLFAIGGAVLGLLLIGIHNAWDTVTHIVAVRLPGDTEE